MKVFSPDFEVQPASCYPSKAHTWESLKRVKSCYEEFVADCDKWGQIPLPLWIFVGTPDGDEERYGFPDYPDYIIEVGPRGGILCGRAY